MSKNRLSKLVASLAPHALALFLLVVLIRGAEGLGERVSLDINDSIVFYQIATSPAFSESSVASQFSKVIVGVGTTFWPNIVLQALGLSSEQQYFVFYLVQMATLAGGLLYFFRAFDRRFAFVLLAVLLALLSGFTGFGRYLVLGGTFKIVTSTFSMTIGFFILGLYIRGRDSAATALAALLASYHPSQGVVLLAIIFGHAAWSTLKGQMRKQQLYRLTAIMAGCLLPFLLLVVARLPSAQKFDPGAWWAYVFSKTSNLTPLQDGLLVVTAIVSTLIFGIVAARAEAGNCFLREEECKIMRRAAALLGVVILLWAVQILASEVLRSIALTQLALTRATPYAVLIIVALYAKKIFCALKDGEPAERVTALILVSTIIFMATKQERNLIILPPVRFPLLDIFHFNHPAVLQQAPVAVLTAVLAWWCWLPPMGQARRWQTAVFLASSVLLCALVFGLRLPILAVALALALLWYPQIVRRLKIPFACSILAIGILTTGVLLDRNSWKRSQAEAHSRILEMVQTHVPPDAMILTIPAGDLAADYLLPIRATFMGWSEGQYLIYLPQLESMVWERLNLLGVHPVVDAPECAGWLLKPMCRRQLFWDKATEYRDAWRGQLKEMRRIAPSLSHVLIRSSHLCKQDRPTAMVDSHALVALQDVAPAGCERAGK